MAMKAYTAWPERVFVIDSHGRFVYVGGYGPEDYTITELEDVLERLFGPTVDGVDISELIGDVVKN